MQVWTETKKELRITLRLTEDEATRMRDILRSATSEIAMNAETLMNIETLISAFNLGEHNED